MTSGEVDAVKDTEDWKCTNCSFSNSQQTEKCQQCSSPNFASKPALVTVEQPPNLQKRKHDEVIDQSTWKCDECQYRNFASANECFKCKTSQEVQLKRKKENPNNWTCASCKNNNWPHRTVCNRCKAPKPGYESQMRNGNDTDWTCLNCDNNNRAFRQECNKCKMSKAEAINPATGQFRTNQDWLCMSCGNSNYPYRIACNKCKLGKHEAMTATRMVESDKPENWLCFNCDNVNLPFRTECNKCKLDKKEGINPDTAFKRTNLDWKCTVCDNVNFYYRVFCNKCSLPKSEIGEDVPPTQPPGDPNYTSNYPSYQGYEQTQYDPVSGAAVPLPTELTGVPTEPIEKAAAQLYRQQQAAHKAQVPVPTRSNYTIQHDVVNSRTDNWTCYNCDNLNYPLRTQCNKCKMSKAEAVAPETRAGRMSCGDNQWRCPGCSNNNYHFRLECNKCKADRPQRTPAPGADSHSYYPYSNQTQPGGYNSGYPAQRYDNPTPHSTPVVMPGEPSSSWICSSCENVNWPKRTKCNKCGIEKSAQNPNWLCAHCNHINYSFVADCGSCKATKDS